MEPQIQYAKTQADVHIACAAPSEEPSLVICLHHELWA